MENIYKSTTSYSKSIVYKLLSIMGAVFLFLNNVSFINNRRLVSKIAVLFSLLMGGSFYNNTFAQNSVITVSTAATSGGTWAVTGAGATLLYTFTSSGATANVSTTEINDILSGIAVTLTGGPTVAAGVPGSATINSNFGTAATGSITIANPITGANPSLANSFTFSLISAGNVTVNTSSAINLTGAAGVGAATAAASAGKYGDAISITAGGTVSIASAITTSGGVGAMPTTGSTNGGNGAVAGAITIAGSGGITISGAGTTLTSTGGAGGAPNGNNGGGAGGLGGNISLTASGGLITIAGTVPVLVSSGGAPNGGSGPTSENGGAGNGAGGNAGSISVTASGDINLGASTGIIANGANAAGCSQCGATGSAGTGNTVTLNSTGGTVTVGAPISTIGGAGSSLKNGSNPTPGVAGGSITVSGASGINIASTITTSGGTGGAPLNGGGIAVSSSGGNSGGISLNSSAGYIGITAALTATGGTGGLSATNGGNKGGVGGTGGSISIIASTTITASAAILATGGMGGNAAGGGETNGNGGNAGAITSTGPGGISISAAVSAAGGAAGNTGGATAGTVGVGNNVTVSDGSVVVGASNTGVSGVISGANLSSTGAGILILSAANTYTGTTLIGIGTLQIGATNAIPSSSNVTMFGGTLSSGSGAGFSDQMGILTISSNSTIHLGTGSNALKFSGAGASWAGLNVTGWAGTAGISGTAGQLFVGTTSAGLTAGQLASTTFTGYGGTGSILATGEVVPTSLINTTPATSITTTSATLNGAFNTGGVSKVTSFTIGTTTDVGTGAPTSIHSAITSVVYQPDSAFITGLQPNTLYTYKALAGATSGGDLTFVTLSNPPTVGSATAITSTGFTANWSAPTGQGAQPLTYTLQVSTDPTFGSGVTTYAGITGTSAPITGLTGVTQYYYRVEAVNTTGPSTWSANSPSVVTAVSPTVSCGTGTGAVGNGGAIISTPIAPVIDGQVDAVWAGVPANTISTVVVGSATASTQTWKAVWTLDSLYFLVQVQDPTLISQSPAATLATGSGGAGGTSTTVAGATQSSNPEYYGSDGVEITLDANYSHGGGYDGVNDAQFRFNLGATNVSGQSAGTVQNYNGSEFLNVYQRIDYKVIVVPGGYNVEVAMPWGTSAANPGINNTTSGYVLPYNLQNIGLDVQVNDANTTGGRNAQYSWFNASSQTYFNPTTFAQATLIICNTPPLVIQPTHTNITATSAVLGATVDSAGRNSVGVTLTLASSGTSFGTSLAGDSVNPAASSPVATLHTPYATPITTGLSPQTKYYHLGYATNSAGITAVSISDSFYTLSQIPTVQPTLSVVPCTKTINWTPVTFPTLASGQATKTGFIILRTVGTTAPTITGITNRIQPSSFVLPGGTTLLANITATNGSAGSGITTSYIDVSAVSGTTYTYLLVPYSWDGTVTDSTFNYYTASAPSISMTYNSVLPTPTFAALPPLCIGATAPVLNTTSINGITGTWSPATVSTVTAGSTTYTFTSNPSFCANNTTLTQVINGPSTSTTNTAICPSAYPYMWNGTPRATAGTYTKTLVNSLGCDSIATLNLTTKAVTTSTTNVAVCPSALPYTFNGTPHGAAGTYTATLVNSVGCDSVATLNLTVKAVTTSTTNVAVCPSALPYTFNGTPHGAAGTYTATLVNSGGCDSVATLNLTVKAVTTSTTNVAVCPSALPYTFNGTPHGAAGTYTATLVNSGGCDSVATLNLTVKAVTTSTTNVAVCPSALPYTFNGTPHGAAGTYTATLVNSVGCDSVATLNLTVKAVTTSTTNVAVCPSALPYTFNGTPHGAAGTYTATLVNSVGCDSVATLNLTVKAVTTSTTNVAVCPSALPYTFNGTPHGAAGTYTATLVNSVGCDSVATLNLTVKAVTTSTTNVAVCPSALPYTFNGTPHGAAGTYTATLVNSVGCDSVATLNLTVKAVTTSTTNVAVCPSALPYTFNGTPHGAAGTYTATLVNSVGCDSVATLNLTVKAVTTSTTNVAVCPSALPYTFNGTPYAVAGTYTATLVNSVGCDSVATLNLTVKAVTTSTTNVAVCPSALPYTFNGTPHAAAGTYTATLVNSVGCDSVATLNLTVKAVTTSTTNVAVCPSALPYTFNGTPHAAAGTYTATLVNSVGCDSVATLNLTVKAVTTSTTNVAVCPSALPYTFNGTPHAAAGTYTATLVNSVGCDSVATLNLTVKAVTTSTTNVAVCPSALPYTFNGTPYAVAGTYTATLVNSVGCDSVATLNLTVKAVTTSTTNVAVCPSALPYTFNGTPYAVAGTYTATLVNSVGCDSVATLNLTVKAVTTSTTNVAVCPSALPYTFNGTPHAAAGTYTATLVNSVGCDSVATLNLTVKAVTTSTTNVAVCPSALPYTFNGTPHGAAGTYTATLVNSVGCDSVATLNLTVKAVTTSTTNVAVCPSALPYTFNGTPHGAAGTYTATLVNSVGCDSVATLNLTVKAVTTSTTNVAVCPSALPYTFNGTPHAAAGTYTATLVNSVGCDSVATLNLTVKAVTTSTTNVAVCPSALPYTFNGTPYAVAGTYTATLVNSVGCDSVATLNLTVKAVTTSTTNVAVCPSALPYTFNGTPYAVAGTYTATLVNSVGCDSVATLNLTVKAVTTSTTNVAVCPSALPYTFNGTPHAAAGTYTATLVNSVGCDSVATLNLTVKAVTTSTTNVAVCPSALPYTFNGTPHGAAGTYTATLVNSVGCDSVATLNLTVKAVTTSTTNVAVCPSALPYTFNGTPHGAAGTYTATLVNSVGCDSVATLNLTVKAVTTSTTNVAVCPSALPYTFNGTPYAVAGTYTATLVNSVGCDSVATLNLTVKAVTTSTTNVAVCPSALPYTFNGTPYAVAGTYTATLVNSVGCDSVATLNLTVKAVTTSTTNVAVCPSALPYTFNGTPYAVAGTYTATLVNSVGCDSVATLNLTVKAVTTSTTNVAICPSAYPYVWNTVSHGAPGTFTATLVNSVGCDSVATLNLTTLAVSTSTTNVAICPSAYPYVWNTVSHAAPGTFTATLVNSVGCDSVATLNLTTLGVSTSTTNVAVCPSVLPYTFNGVPHAAAGTYTATLVNSVGCDSVATLNLTVKAVTTSTTNVAVCPSALPYTFNGTPYNTAGTYTATLVNAAGCDSIATLNLAINATSTSTTNVSICPSSLPYTWNGTPYNAAGTYTGPTLTGSTGCDSIPTLILTVKSITTSTTNVAVCPSALPYTFNGTPHGAAGTYTATLVNSVGCDSVATLNLTVKAVTTSTTNVAICPSAYPYVWNTVSHAAPGTFTATLVNSVGCDSVATLNLTTLAVSTSTTNVAICPSAYPYVWNTVSHAAPGTFTATLVNSVGCDSVATLNLTTLGVSTSTTNVAVCPSVLPYTFNGVPHAAAGTYTATLVNSVGCDSVATLNLTVKAVTTSTTNVAVCPSALPYTFNGTPYNTAGTYTATLVNAAGCDSIATLNLAINATSTSTTNVSICPSSLPYTWNGTPYNAAGTYTGPTLTGSTGCDSIPTLILTVKSITTSTTNVAVCPSALPYTFNGTPHGAAGTYTATLVNSVGCDSVATLNLTVKAVTTSTTNVAICPSAYPYVWNTVSHAAPGTFTATLVNSVGCDSVATLNLTTLGVSTSTTNVAVCPSVLPYTFNGVPHAAAGTYTATLVNSVGCDSVATLNLTVKAVTTSTTNVAVCPSALPYTFNGTPYNTAGTYTATLVNAAGCDSIATLNLAINATSTSTTNVSICPSSLPYTWNGTPYNAAGTYTGPTLTGSTGCDSIPTLILTVKSITTSTTNVAVCPSALPYTFNGTPHGAAGTYTATLVNSVGCDSVATLNLTVKAVTTSTTNVAICPSAYPYVWNTVSHAAPGTFTATLVNSVGCDSVATLNLTTLAVSTSTTNVAICPSAYPYVWNTVSHAAPGTFTATLVNSVGCDSVATLNLTTLAVSTSTTNVAVCPSALPYTFNGTPYNTAGTYTATLVNSVGCDSVATLNLAINAISTSTTNITVCSSALPYTWNGTPYNAAGTYTGPTLTGSTGCDSIPTLVLTVNAPTTSTTNIAVCPSALPYVWNTVSYNAAGTYTATLVNSVGCDSVATLNLAINATSTSTTNVTVCSSALPYTWNGTPYNAAGTYTGPTLTGSTGCDSIPSLVLTVNAPTTSTTNIAVCPSALPYVWNTVSYNTAGTYTATLVNSVGCDSVATLNLAINTPTTSTTSVTVCPSALPYVWNTVSYNTAGTYTATLVNSVGCDSVATLNLAINATSTSTTNVTVCSSALPYTWNGTPYNAAGTYTGPTLTGSTGCDSIPSLVLTVNAPTTSTTNIAVCPSALPYVWNTVSYNTAGTYTATLVNSVGCDSVATLNLAINTPTTSTTSVTVCPSALPYVWNTVSYNTAGTYTATLVNSVGCDSVATLNLAINATSTSTTNVTVCSSALPYTWNGTPYNAAGTYTGPTLTGSTGCDSIPTLVLTVNAPTTSTTNIAVCSSALPYVWNTVSYNTAGTYTATLVNSAGCDSVATLNLAINTPTTSTTNIAVCSSALPYVWNTVSYNTAGTYTATLVNSVGCDSVATLNLAINTPTTSTTSVTVCPSALPYVWNTVSYNTAGTYTATLVNSVGCDSVATLNLAINATSTSTTNVTVCSSALPYTWNGTPYNAAGTYTGPTLTGSTGCDSIPSLVLTVNAPTTSTTNIAVCPSALPYVWNTVSYNTAGTYTATLVNSVGCDSVATLNLAINTPTTSTTSVTVCPSALPYVWNTVSYNTAGTYTATLVNSVGCDSVATLNLAINATSTSTTNVTVCSSALPYTWNGTPYNAAGTYTGPTLTGSTGCDSIPSLVLTVNAPTTSTTNIAVCPSALPYVWNTVSYNTAGTYTATLVNSVGCDSVATLNLAINTPTTSTTSVTVCPSALPYVWNTVSYNTAGTYTATLVNSVGCDSVATLNLAINATSTSTTNVTVCSSALPYTWNGTPYNAAGTYTGPTLTGSTGCDSIPSLVLTVNAPTTSTTNIAVCPSALPYVWNTVSYNTAGTYTATLVNSVGCDSVATLNLAINATSTSTTNVTVCSSALPYMWNGTPYNAAGTYTGPTLTGSTGCDSIPTLVLTVSAPTTSTTNIAVCPSALPYVWNTVSYNAAGTYTATLVNSVGCDSVATLNLAINTTSTSTTNVTVCSSALPYTWNGTPYNAAGTYTGPTLTGSTGCDSIPSLVLTVNAPTTSTTNIAVCPSALPYVWNTVSYNTAGTYTATLVNSVGCDSVATLNLAINTPTTSTTSVTVCPSALPYVWNTVSYNTAGTYTATLVNSVGCDSVATLNLAINATSTSTTNVTVCSSALPYTWNGTPYNAAGTYTGPTLTGSTGCDSIPTLVLTVNAPTTSTTNIAVCSSALPYVWNTVSYNTAGTYTATLVNSAGCDSVATLNLAINTPTTSTTSVTVCPSALPYVWNTVSYNAAGTYTATLVNSVGCDSVATLNLAINATSTSTTNVTVCSSALPYTWNGTPYNAAGTYTGPTLTGSTGCDSIPTLVLTVNAPTTSTTNIAVCSSALPYVWNTVSYNTAGTYTATLVNSAGCDSVATLNLAINTPTTSTTSVTVCPSALPYVWNTVSYNTAGTYTATLVNSVGCDSVATLNLAINATSTSTTNVTVCSSALPYTWNGTPYNAAGTYTGPTLTGSTGCDSIPSLVLTVNAPTTSTTNIAVCPSALPYVWNTVSYNTAGTYTATLVNSVGCDSVATLNLAINTPTTSTTSVTVCPSALPYVWNTVSYNTAGTYTATLVNSVGCDSVATLNLAINATSTSTTNVTVCSSALPYTWNGTPYNAAGTYTGPTLTGSTGCDSIPSLVLTVNAPTTSTTNIAVCPSALPYVWNTVSYNAAGTYTATLVNSAGCDSVATLNLAINTPTTSTTSVTVCPSALPYVWNTVSYNAAGTYTATLVNSVGCDSVATLNLAINATSTSTTNVTVCSSALPYTWNGTPYNAAGTYTGPTLTGSTGCDSIPTLVLTVNAPTTSITNIAVCPSALPYVWNTVSYNAAGTYTATLVNSVGCDSVATLNLAINTPTTSTTSVTVCPSALPYTFNGTPYNTAGTYTATLVNSVGCDSVATLNLAINATSTSTTNVTVCSSALPYTWNGTPYNAAGTYTGPTLTGSTGCDSIPSLVLTVNAPTTSTTNIAVCPSALPYVWNTVSYNAAGTYTATLVNSVGCDSVATLNLAINTPTTSTTSVTVCPSALPYVWNTVSYNTAGTYTATLVNSVGCDSVATLVLTVNVPTTSTTSVTICPSALPYTFNGTPYSAPGTYTVILTNAAGCDSVATLNLTVNAASASTTNVTVCSSALPYSWNGTPYNAAGTYTAMFTNSVGCDSIATLNLAVTTPATSTTTVTVCPASLPYTWNGTQYNAAGNYTGPTFASAAGCDSIPKLVLVVSGGAIPAFTPLTAICNGSVPQTLPTTSINNITGTWSPATINNTATTTYTFTPTAGQCATPITVTQTVTQLQTPTFDPLSAICYGTPASSLPGISNEGVTGTWNPAIINNTRTETYTFTPTPGLCQTKATLVQAITALPTASIDNPNPIVMYVGANDGQVVLPGHASGGTIAWTINEGGINSAPISIIEQPTVTPGAPTGSDADPLTVTTNYVLTVTSSAGCQATANINVQVIQKLVIPNIFSPNGDGINETFDIAHIHEFPNVDVSIFNRYGQFIFKSHGYNVPWDGNYEGQPLPVGTYFYIIKTTPDAKPISGPISIVR